MGLVQCLPLTPTVPQSRLNLQPQRAKLLGFMPQDAARRVNSVAEYDWPTSANPTSVPVQADVGGMQVTVLNAGAAPSFPGVYQINVIIPPTATTTAGTNVRIFEGYAQTHPKVIIPIR